MGDIIYGSYIPDLDYNVTLILCRFTRAYFGIQFWDGGGRGVDEGGRGQISSGKIEGRD